MLFGLALGPRLHVGPDWELVVGPELFGATALRGSNTAFEALLTGRLEGTHDEKMQVRFKLGIGVGDGAFGAPDFRLMAGVEIFNHNHVGPD